MRSLKLTLDMLTILSSQQEQFLTNAGSDTVRLIIPFGGNVWGKCVLRYRIIFDSYNHYDVSLSICLVGGLVSLLICDNLLLMHAYYRCIKSRLLQQLIS